jgi:hypothetical protein
MWQGRMTSGRVMGVAAGVAFAVLSTCTVMPASALAHRGAGGNDTARLCRHGGWRTLQTSDGQSFRNQGRCIRYAKHGGILRSQLPGDDEALWQMVCEDGGGNFTASPGLWDCSAPFPGLSERVYEFLSGTCSEAGGVTAPAQGGPGLPEVQCQNPGTPGSPHPPRVLPTPALG